jgi:hypothetical protein
MQACISLLRGDPGMIRIMTAAEPQAFTITVDGLLAGEYVEALDTCVNQAIGRGRPVHLFRAMLPASTKPDVRYCPAGGEAAFN